MARGRRPSLERFRDQVALLKDEYNCRAQQSEDFSDSVALRSWYARRLCALFQSVYALLKPFSVDAAQVRNLFYGCIAPELLRVEAAIAPRLYLGSWDEIPELSDDESAYLREALPEVMTEGTNRQINPIDIAAAGPQMERFREDYKRLYQRYI